MTEKKPVNRCISTTLMYWADLVAVEKEDGSYLIYKNKITDHRGDNIEETLFRGVLAQAERPIVLHHAYVLKDEHGHIQFN